MEKELKALLKCETLCEMHITRGYVKLEFNNGRINGDITVWEDIFCNDSHRFMISTNWGDMRHIDWYSLIEFLWDNGYITSKTLFKQMYIKFRNNLQ